MHPQDALAYKVAKREREARDAGRVRARVMGVLVYELDYDEETARRLANAAMRGFQECQRAESGSEPAGESGVVDGGDDLADWLDKFTDWAHRADARIATLEKRSDG